MLCICYFVNCDCIYLVIVPGSPVLVDLYGGGVPPEHGVGGVPVDVDRTVGHGGDQGRQQEKEKIQGEHARYTCCRYGYMLHAVGVLLHAPRCRPCYSQ